MSARPRDAAKWRGVVPEPIGCTPLGGMERWDKSNETVEAGDGQWGRISGRKQRTRGTSYGEMQGSRARVEIPILRFAL